MVGKKQVDNSLFFGLPKEIIKKNKLAPFMIAKFDAKKKRLISFGRTVKLDVNLDEESLRIINAYKQLSGFASLDEAVNSMLVRYFKIKQNSVYLYPKDYLSSRFELIADYEKAERWG